MPKISNLPSVITVDINDLLAIVSKDNQNVEQTMKIKISELALKLNNNIEYGSLNTSDKKILGAINEVAGKWVSGTLTAGSTSLTLSDASILTTSTIDIYVSEYGIQPINAVVATGSITLSFLAQASDISVKVRIS
jgi:hypothetical protein